MPITRETITGMLSEDHEGGLFRVRRSAFTDDQLFELEMKHIFEQNWVFLGHEAQIPNHHDFLTTRIGRQPVIITRTGEGDVVGFLNSCTHRGTELQIAKCGNARRHTCPFHSWTFSSSGKLLAFGDSPVAGYGDGFRKADLDLMPVAHVESYRGFIFGSLSADVMSLEDHLDEAKVFIDMIVEQDPNGEIEIIPGPQAYTFEGNWKLQTENGVDGYHVNTIHGNYVATTKNRAQLDGANARVKPMDVASFSKFPGGFYAFRNGHVVLWNQSPNPEVRATWNHQADITDRSGNAKGWWMINCWRNLCLYPNVFLMDQMSSQIRIIHPLSTGKTEIRTLCFAPKSDTPEERANRIRQYEDFFNASGMATPDDVAAFNASQRGFQAAKLEWSDVSRGSQNIIEGGDERAAELGIRPRFSGTQLQDEAIYLNQHHHWQDLLLRGIGEAALSPREALNA
jgi:benzoate/toluate 1,2-dioxygenase subunit alpha